MFLAIARFELRYQLRAPVFAIGAALFFLLTFASVTIDTVQIGARGNVNINSPEALCRTMGIMAIFSLFIVCAFVSNVVLRDDETGFAPLVRATPITDGAYLCGRFAGALAISALVLLMVPLAIWVGAAMPWLDPEKIGPFVALHYLYAYFIMGLPALIILGAVLFAIATQTRSMAWTYVGLLALLVLYLGTRAVLSDPAYDTLAVVSDPFGLSGYVRATRYWTTAERNTRVPELDSLWLMSRGLWCVVGALAFGVAYVRFARGATGVRVRLRTPETEGLAKARVAPSTAKTAAPLAQAASTRGAPGIGWGEFIALARFDLASVFKSPAFFVLIALGALNALGSFFATINVRGVDYWPVTRSMINDLAGAFAIIPIVLAIFYSGELVWRDRDRRIDEIIGATPAPDWAFVLPKILAITLALIVSLVCGAAAAVVFQAFLGYTRFEVNHYLVWFVVPQLLVAYQLAALAIFVQIVVPHKFIGWAVMLLYIVATTALQGAGFEHHLYDYAGSSPVPLSDMNGQGRFWIGRAAFEVYWSAAATILLLISYGLWRRSRATPLAGRLRRLGRILRGAPGAALAICLIVFIGSGSFIFYNTNVLNHYQTEEDTERYLAELERTLLPFENVPQPRITDVKLAVDLFPEATRALMSGEWRIENRTSDPLPAVHLRWKRPLVMTRLDVEGAHVERDFGDLNYRIYTFDHPLLPGESRLIRFESRLEERGFPNERPLTRLVENGTFLANDRIEPLLGMDRDDLLKSRAKRRKYGLPAELRQPKLEDESADQYNLLRRDSDWINLDITLSTDADQTPVAPGRTLSDTVAAGRRTVHTHSDALVLHYFSLQSARYERLEGAWAAANGTPVALDVYYQKGHDYNVERMLSVMQTSLELYSKQFSPFQFHQMRILEFPAYETFAESFANTVPFSESIGFIQRYDEGKIRAGESYDLVTFVTAHEVAHQWWGHQLIGAPKQGGTMLAETFAQYSALLVMEKLYGPQMMRQFLKYELDAYLRGRGRESVEELPLVRVEDQDYVHYRKGALVMWWLKDTVGEETVNRSLRRLLARYAFHGAPYASASDFVKILREESPPEAQDLITDLFERITLYDMKALDAHAKRLPDGRYAVRFTVLGRKLYADGLGVETEAPLSEPFEVGAFTVEPGKKGFTAQAVLDLERHPLVSGSQEVRLIVNEPPKWVGVDPYNKRIDRNSDDNLTAVVLDP